MIFFFLGGDGEGGISTSFYSFVLEKGAALHLLTESDELAIVI